MSCRDIIPRHDTISFPDMVSSRDMITCHEMVSCHDMVSCHARIPRHEMTSCNDIWYHFTTRYHIMTWYHVIAWYVISRRDMIWYHAMESCRDVISYQDMISCHNMVSRQEMISCHDMISCRDMISEKSRYVNRVGVGAYELILFGDLKIHPTSTILNKFSARNQFYWNDYAGFYRFSQVPRVENAVWGLASGSCNSTITTRLKNSQGFCEAQKSYSEL